MDERRPSGFKLMLDSPSLIHRRQPKPGEWFIASHGFVALRQGDPDVDAQGSRPILDPIYAEEPAPAGTVQVPRELVERLRDAWRRLGDTSGAKLADARIALDDEILALLGSVSPLTPPDPLKSEEFSENFLNGLPGCVSRVRSWIRANARAIADFEARRTGGAK